MISALLLISRLLGQWGWVPDADFRAITTLHSLPIFLLVKWMMWHRHRAGCLESRDSIRSSLHLSWRNIYQRLSSSHQVSACQRQVEATKANLVCWLPLDVRDVHKRGARQQGSWAACISFSERPAQQRSGIFIPGSPSGQQWNRRYTAQKHLQPLTLGLIHHPAKREKPGSSLI